MHDRALCLVMRKILLLYLSNIAVAVVIIKLEKYYFVKKYSRRAMSGIDNVKKE
jgi:hypothetical protein